MSAHQSGGAGRTGPAAASKKTPAGKTDLHILDHLAVLYRYRLVAASVFALTTLSVLTHWYTTERLYRSQARLLIEDERSTAIPALSTQNNAYYYEDPAPYYQTQLKILKGRELIRKVVNRLNLASVPEFNGAAATGMPPATPPEEASLISAFADRVSVEQVRGSRLVDVAFTSTDPQFAATAVNALAEEYVAQNLELKLTDTGNTLEWLTKELANQQKKVEESEHNLAEYRQKQNALSLDDKQNIVIARLNQLNDAAIRAKTVRMQREAAYDQVKGLPPGAAVDALPVIAEDAAVQNVKARLADLQRQKTQASSRYGDKHPETLRINAEIDDQRRQLQLETRRVLTTVKNEFDSAVLEEQTLNRSLEAAKADAVDLNEKSVGYTVMEREAQSNRQIYESLLQLEKELRVASNSRANNIRIVDRGEAPGGPITPGLSRTLLTALTAGLALAIGLAFGLDYMNDTIKTPADVAERLDLPFLGFVPSVRGIEHPLMASAKAPHEFAEAFRTLRTSMLGNFNSPGPKTLVITSSQPLEGKTTMAANIAMALAFSGTRVLIVDADMRRPGLHRALRLTNERGLSQVLSGQARVRDVIQRTVDPNLLAVTAGALPSNPSELLSSERMKALLTNLQHGPFEWIIIDTPPVLAVTDAVILAPLVSGVTFVVGAEMTRRRHAERAIETIMRSRPRATGVVLNKVDVARNKYYYSRYHGQEYKSYYAEAAV